MMIDISLIFNNIILIAPVDFVVVIMIWMMRFNNVEMMADNQIINEVLVIFFFCYLFCFAGTTSIRSDPTDAASSHRK